MSDVPNVRRGLCICSCFEHPGDICLAPLTQEDLLCDACRQWFTNCREVRAGTRETSGIHAAGLDGRHQQYQSSALELHLRPSHYEKGKDGIWQQGGVAQLPVNPDDLIGQHVVIQTKPEDTI